MARTSVATNMRKVLPWVNRVSGVLLVLSGAYLVVYGWWEIQVLRGNITQNALVGFFEDFQTEVNIWIDQTGATRLGTALLVIVGAALVRAVWADLGPRGRIGAVGASSALWVWGEFVREWNGERLNLLVLPIVRTIIQIPERIGNWFTDPIRWGVLGELIVVAVIGMSVWFRVKRRRAVAIEQTRADELVDA